MEKVDIDFGKKLATITMKEGERLTKEDLDKAFKDSSFSVTKFETDGEDADAEQRSIHKATISGMK